MTSNGVMTVILHYSTEFRSFAANYMKGDLYPKNLAFSSKVKVKVNVDLYSASSCSHL